MRNYFKKILLFTMVIALVACSEWVPTPTPVATVKELTLTPVNVSIPSKDTQKGLPSLALVSSDDHYVFKRSLAIFATAAYALYYNNGQMLEEVSPPVTASIHCPLISLEVCQTGAPGSPALFIATATYFLGTGTDGSTTLDVLHGSKREKLISSLSSIGDWIRSLDGIQNGPFYVDKRGNLFVLDKNRMLFLIQSGHIIAKFDTNKLDQAPFIPPYMFSDNDNTYFVVPSDNYKAEAVSFEEKYKFDPLTPLTENDVKAKYKINF